MNNTYICPKGLLSLNKCYKVLDKKTFSLGGTFQFRGSTTYSPSPSYSPPVASSPQGLSVLEELDIALILLRNSLIVAHVFNNLLSFLIVRYFLFLFFNYLP